MAPGSRFQRKSVNWHYSESYLVLHSDKHGAFQEFLQYKPCYNLDFMRNTTSRRVICSKNPSTLGMASQGIFP